MNATVKYFLKLLGEYQLKRRHSPSTCLVFKNFMIGEDGRKVWTPDDMKNGILYKKTCIIGRKDEWGSYYINMSEDDVVHRRSCPFEYNWQEWGDFYVDFDMVKDGPLTKFLESIFMQILLAVNKGNNIFLDTDCIMKKNTSYEHLMNIDMMDAVE